jgi:hypothetical protein
MDSTHRAEKACRQVTVRDQQMPDRPGAKEISAVMLTTIQPLLARAT